MSIPLNASLSIIHLTLRHIGFTTHWLFELFHVKFIEWKDDIPCPLYPGHVIDLPSIDPPGNPSDNLTSTPLAFSSSTLPTSVPSTSISVSSTTPKHAVIPDEEEPINDTYGQVWTVPNNDDEVPVPVLDNPTDVVPVLVGDIANVPHQSAQAPAPTSKAAENLGIKCMPHVVQAVVESCEAGCHLKEQCAQAKFE